jgi:hypothetical protein
MFKRYRSNMITLRSSRFPGVAPLVVPFGSDVLVEGVLGGEGLGASSLDSRFGGLVVLSCFAGSFLGSGGVDG